ncbi:ribokinase [Devosia limi DSM 17137]|uniref:Ribokinase n=1 Tax=Devosia limi DSM 17137 TaxID=1121477 RepID=A0A0F5L444_9HYPH|nr:ribokinase [Devosia limi]KKB76397.1 ribokinase [Devosia limi DSM 17137]SHF70634.1 ribokinase [Devosia limi DSM 17137]
MITVFGSTNLDQVGTVSRLPRPGETVAGGTFSMAAGGKGANQALAARRAGAEVRHFSAVGADAFADAALELLKADGVDLSNMRIAEGPTGIAMIFVDTRGENVIAVLPGANGTMTPADAETALKGMDAGTVLLLQQEIPQAATERALDLSRAQDVISILNTAPFIDSTRTVAPKATILIANETEFALLTGRGIDELDAAMQDWARAHDQTVIVTLGPDGAKAATPNGLIQVPALQVTPVDTVGAGDTFCGYLAAGLDAGLELEAAMRRAAVAASLACLNPGAQPAIPYASDVAAAL